MIAGKVVDELLPLPAPVTRGRQRDISKPFSPHNHWRKLVSTSPKLALIVAVHESAFGTKRHHATEFQCPLLGVKRTSGGGASMSAFDPKRTLAIVVRMSVLDSICDIGAMLGSEFVDLDQIHNPRAQIIVTAFCQPGALLPAR